MEAACVYLNKKENILTGTNNLFAFFYLYFASCKLITLLLSLRKLHPTANNGFLIAEVKFDDSGTRQGKFSPLTVMDIIPCQHIDATEELL